MGNGHELPPDHRRADDPIVVTTRDIYDQLMTVSVKVDQLHNGHAQREARAADHEARLRGLERRSWQIPAAAFMAMSALVAALIDNFGTGGVSP